MIDSQFKDLPYEEIRLISERLADIIKTITKLDFATTIIIDQGFKKTIDAINSDFKKFENIEIDNNISIQSCSPFPSVSELFGVKLINLAQPEPTPKTANEIIQAKKNKRGFYKQFDRLKKWEK